jgi:YD repeat-containing protein
VVKATRINIGQLKTAFGAESGGVTNRLQEKMGYAYDSAGNLFRRTNNALVQTFNVNDLNELTTGTRTGTLTVAGTTTSAATNVTVNGLSASLYQDATFAKDGFTVTNGNNTFAAVAKDSLGRQDSSSVTVNLPATNSFTYDLNGNLVSDGLRAFDYDDENQLIRITVTNAWKSEFTYDGRMRCRVEKNFAWTGSAWQQTNEVRFVYDGDLVVQERDANNLPQVTYTRGNDLSGSLQGAGGIGGLLARTDINGPCFYHADGNGIITALINGPQLIAAKYLYDSFGNILSIDRVGSHFLHF